MSALVVAEDYWWSVGRWCVHVRRRRGFTWLCPFGSVRCCGFGVGGGAGFDRGESVGREFRWLCPLGIGVIRIDAGSGGGVCFGGGGGCGIELGGVRGVVVARAVRGSGVISLCTPVVFCFDFCHR